MRSFVSFTLPSPKRTVSAPQLSLSASFETALVSNRRVLLVDDNLVNLQVLIEALEDEGYELLVAMNGQEALKVAEESNPALILLDINMPVMDGFAACQALKVNELTRDIAIIFLSARDATNDKVKGLRMGAVDYISKPFQFEEVVARVRTQIELKEARQLAMHESARSQKLLLNILPETIATRLKKEEKNPVDEIPDASIFFCDLVGFTSYAASQDPAAVVQRLNLVFSNLDALIFEYGLEKIKTIGDAYMAAGGVPESKSGHLVAMARFALALRRHWPRIQRDTELPLGLRMGIHCGPVVAGVIGDNKFAYDVWGDTVNMASRLEASGQPGFIHVSAEVAHQLRGDFWLEAQGPLQLRGKGLQETFHLMGQHER